MWGCSGWESVKLRPMRILIFLTALLMTCLQPAKAGVLDKQKLLEAQTWWDNKDWDWYKDNIPFLDCPDPDILTTYYYRWQLVTKHLVYGSTKSGYSFTEFIDRPFWSGTYGSISCPAGHQLYEVRWLVNPRYGREYAAYWHRTRGAQPRRYTTWLADGTSAFEMVHPDPTWTTNLLPDLIKNYEGWEKEHFDAKSGMFQQNGHDDGMEFNINSRQSQDILRGAPGFRPTINAYMWADALAIARFAREAGESAVAERFTAKARDLKSRIQKVLWDPNREFFFPMSFRDEKDKEGNMVTAGSLTYQTGKFAGNPHGRELIGYVPWQFSLPDSGYEAAWKFLMDPSYFGAPFGPTTVGRKDPMFYLSPGCCWWSGRSWPYATAQTLTALANLLNNYQQNVVTKNDYFELLRIYTLTHRKNGQPYLAEAADPFTGSWDGHDGYNHSEHYFHSSYCDLIISGLIGLRPHADQTLEIHPLVPDHWDYFALDDVFYRGLRLTIVWDRTGQRYGRGAGLSVLAGSQPLGHAPKLEKLKISLPNAPRSLQATFPLNFAVNNDGRRFPRLSCTFESDKTPLMKVNDGNYWYSIHPPNRWTTKNSPNASDSIEVDFGAIRRIDTVKLYLLDDSGEKEVTEVAAPEKVVLEHLAGSRWEPVPLQKRTPQDPTGDRANTIHFPALDTTKLRITLTPRAGKCVGLTEIETWGPVDGPQENPAALAGNLALAAKVSASFTSNYDLVEEINDENIQFRTEPRNRWTSYGSKSSTDWVDLDFGQAKEFSRVELDIYDDRGGVQPPESFRVETWTGSEWKAPVEQKFSPETPAGSRRNTVTFPTVRATKLRIVFTHKGQSRSGLTEVEVWK